jgi:RNA polymerase sigma-70 factor (ECF subfamily)
MTWQMPEHRTEPPGNRAVIDPLAAARRGDEGAFDRLFAPYRRELHVHCYRMLGSLDDADDAMQETSLRAWRHLDSYQPTAPIRAWFYRIATNVCLTALQHRTRRHEIASSALLTPDGDGTITEGDIEHMRLDPYPDHMLDELPASVPGPESRVELNESVELAFVSAVQLLPARQRAALLLRDVIGYPASEVASLLETSAASINSALQRARATLKQQREYGPISREHRPASSDTERELVRKLMTAWESANIPAVVATLTEDALVTMPPGPGRYVGRASIAQFLTTIRGGALDRFRLIPTRANRQPALAMYMRDGEEGPFTAHAILVLAIDDSKIASIVRMGDAGLVTAFGFPATYPDAR